MIRLGLDAMRGLMEALGNPQDALSVIHVAGTNGKGSVCAFLRNILTEAGYRVGCYNSPAVFDPFEQYLLGDEPISREAYQRISDQVDAACQKITADGGISPTAFERETAIAFCYFYEKKCDYVILEVGLGGDGDATNVLRKSLLSVFCSIGMDHMAYLGDDIQKIASKKAGILKEGGCAVSIWQEKSVLDVVIEQAKKKHVSLRVADQGALVVSDEKNRLFSYKGCPVKLSLFGTYQIDNAVLAMEAIFALRKLGVSVSDAEMQRGFKKTSWPGRMECVCKDPLVFIDGCHNLPAAKRLAETIDAYFTNETITFIMGVLADKAYEAMLDVLLPYAVHIYTVTPENARALGGDVLAEKIRKKGGTATYCESISDAVEKGMNSGSDVLLAFGSLSYLKEIKQCIQKEKNLV